MKIKTIDFKGKKYPRFQAEGNAAQFAIPYAKHVCKGEGVDVGCGKKEWSFPGARPIDLSFNEEFNAMDLPHMSYDYIFSSHLLEHITEPWKTLDYWTECLKYGGILFLYLPEVMEENSNHYHLPWNNTKHKNIIESAHVYRYMEDNDYINIYMSGTDLNSSYMIFGEKG